MSGVRLLVLFGTLPLLLIQASAALAAPGCDAPPDTAATQQYCETLAAPQGLTDVTQPAARPLGEMLPKPLAAQLEDSGVLGDVLMAIPTGDMLLALGEDPSVASPPRVAAARRARFDPRVKALSPGPGVSASSAINATASAGAATLKVGFGWVLVFILLFLAGFSLGTRGLGNGRRA